MLTAAKGDSSAIEPIPSILSDPAVLMVMLKSFAFPASSLMIKLAPLEYPEAAGNLMSSAAEAETPKIRSLTEEVSVEVTALLE